MKQLIKTTIPVEITGISDWTTISKVEIAFAQRKNGSIIKQVEYPSEVTRTGNVLYIPWSRADSKLFREGASFWMDIRPTTTGGDDLEIAPLELLMNWTLFEE